ncbi:6-hydroxy-D-nicotine oxidase [Fusarium subglutinans]|uniref:6-hydroxy-D-nicotine oxidase n=1 Tax=Gibberella subglutinans TaxID=42677 RepID=A0A8H5P6W5_GIBSU|nr:6-hydroxy-D-nicotine oxidase [Fusarium subglutinans]KAF5591158.1 6-hydroxy-D-nicotine oxidase [Fusarium subglutinans]
MLLNKAFLGALLAMGTVAALPNPDAEPADLEDRSILHHCGEHASWDHAKSECVCHDSGKVYTKKHHKCKCPKGEKWHHVEKNVLASTCCHQLKGSLGDKISFPDTKSYNATLSSYWSKQESALHPNCVLQPTTAHDVAAALKIISKQKDCKFSIKGQGHAPAAGFANFNGGVTIDMTTLSSVSLNKKSTIVSIGAGAKWLKVYQHLDLSGVQVAGGRNGNVGVGGLLLGGGISHFTTQVGWACDKVVNYEVVLANGTLISANKKENSDLFLALKGGGNNFGVITRFDVEGFPQGDISTTSISYDISERDKVFQAFTDLLDSSTYDPSASLVTSLLYSSVSKAWSLSASAVYTKPVSQPEIFEGLSNVPHTKLVNNITTLAEFADEKDTPPLNWLFATLTFKPSAQNMQYMFETFNKTIYSFNPQDGVTWSIAFEPLVAAMLDGPKHTNVLGLQSTHDGYIVLISALWPNLAVSSNVDETAKKVLSVWEEDARAKGLLQMFQYLNYAAPYQRPFESYGDDELEFLKSVSKKYDPAQILQKRVGGFKL